MANKMKKILVENKNTNAIFTNYIPFIFIYRYGSSPYDSFKFKLSKHNKSAWKLSMVTVNK